MGQVICFENNVIDPSDVSIKSPCTQAHNHDCCIAAHNYDHRSETCINLGMYHDKGAKDYMLVCSNHSYVLVCNGHANMILCNNPD